MKTIDDIRAEADRLRFRLKHAGVHETLVVQEGLDIIDLVAALADLLAAGTPAATVARDLRQANTGEEALLVTPARAAQLIGLSRSSVYNLIEAGTFRAVHYGTAVRIPIEDVRAYVNGLIAEPGRNGRKRQTPFELPS